jgi:hypothetical protein
MPSLPNKKGNKRKEPLMKELSKESAQEIAVDFVKKKKSTPKVDVSTIEQDDEDWVVRGTCPIDLEGHPWAERFEVVIDQKGKVKSIYCTLL